MRLHPLPVLLLLAACSQAPQPNPSGQPVAPEPTGRDNMAYRWGAVILEGTASVVSSITSSRMRLSSRYSPPPR